MLIYCPRHFLEKSLLLYCLFSLFLFGCKQPDVSNQDATIYINNPRVIAALDTKTGAIRWQKDSQGPAYASMITSSKQLYVPKSNTVQILDLKTGNDQSEISLSAYSEFQGLALANDILYVGDSNSASFYAFDTATGKTKWSFSNKYGGVFSVAAISSGSVFFGNSEGQFYALDALTGNVKWTFRALREINSSPVVVNGVVYFGCGDGKLYALDAVNGTIKWSFAAGGGIDSSPKVANGIIYVGSQDNNVYAIDAATGLKRWTFETGDDVSSSPVVAEGILYVGSNDQNLYAIDATSGQQKWVYKASKAFFLSSPVVLDEMVYIGGSDGMFYALDVASGTVKWTFKGGVFFGATAVICRGGSIVGHYPSNCGSKQ
ncbi:PQQ-binding-like beta-propeller repeat protein [Spirosoma pollinicola]|uniref:Pyrrolo-quinoline quinone repeat domain-containing protein n=1 Tax=Spirosoma pollinicola TaxID=2057025 RepID=A0A2K8Z2J6_9BACT|nr:PQQ-binding-like beta-propeller repeat protein [Spirosoma pollinicola]AUD04088.1 hypothetical protein CWM47_20995 [Spirosoma pollinicola]